MKLPVILVIDDDPQVLRAIARDVRNQYKGRYRVMNATSANEALDALRELKRKREDVALLLSDQRMPEMLGVAFLEQGREIFPDARRALLTAYSDVDAAIRAINDAKLNYYLTKPWDPPEERLFPVLDDLLDEWEAAHVPEYSGMQVLGHPYSPRAFAIKDFLAGNLFPFRWVDVEAAPNAEDLVATHSLAPGDFPVVVLEDGGVLKNPEITQLAARLGLRPEAERKVYDVAIIGAGPAGLAAAVYGASEGLQTLLIERRAPGGQAGASSRIENYLGFPSGLSGSDLSRRAVTQATRFGAELLSPQEVKTIEVNDRYKILHLADGKQVSALAVVLAMGVSYRMLEAPGVADFTGAGVYYGAANTEAGSCRGKDVYIVGGGNSAGQAAMYLSNYAHRVRMLIRGADLSATMSSYLIEQINQTENIEVWAHTEVKEARGTDRLECLLLLNNESKEEMLAEAAALFVFIGAKPMTDWLPETVLRDARGFVETGPLLKNRPDFARHWKLERGPALLETSLPGVFAAGDVRSTAMNRVASAVGEGAMSIKFTHEYLAGA